MLQQCWPFYISYVISHFYPLHCSYLEKKRKEPIVKNVLKIENKKKFNSCMIFHKVVFHLLSINSVANICTPPIY